MNAETNQAINDITEAYKRLNNIRAHCKHTIVPSDHTWIGASEGICSECGYSTGSWYCPKNPPSHVCDYTPESGETCIHCGLPEERK